VTFTRLHGLARRQRQRAVLLAVVLCLAGAVMVAHGALAADHMGHGAAMCLAVMTASGLAVLRLAHATSFPVGRRLGASAGAARVLAVLGPRPAVRCRAGPSTLQVFLL
jgi:hypothetical protein